MPEIGNDAQLFNGSYLHNLKIFPLQSNVARNLFIAELLCLSKRI